jgi:hypothetical protein
MSDPPAPDPGALTPIQRGRLMGFATRDDAWGWSNVAPSDVAAVLALVDAQAARLAADQRLIADLVAALEQHRRDMHQRSSRPCATCQQSKAALAAVKSAGAAGVGEARDGA